MKLLITSVGSLLGQNVLDIIENRRHLINVVGTNSIAENPRNFRCDNVYLVSETNSDRFLDEFTKLVRNENPDLILPGRDEDCIFLSDFKGKHQEEFGNKIPLGSSLIPKVMLDKYLSYQFCQENKLPFADTYLYTNQNDKKGLEDFIQKHGFPLLVKPREGFASAGVCFVLNKKQVNEIIKSGEVMFQEYMGNPDDILKYKNVFKSGIPLFFQIPEKEQYAAQTIIFPDGTIDEVFFTLNTMIHGRAEFSKQIFDKEVEELAQKYAKAFHRHGWIGPANFQLKKDKTGKWKVFELNPRLTGTSSGRALLGYDEFGKLVNMLRPDLNIPDLTKKDKVKGTVIKYLYDNLLLANDVEVLKSEGIWKKVLITGANGYLGACIYEELKKKRKSVFKLQNRLEDIRPESIDCDVVIHTAGALRYRKGQHQKANLEGTINLIRGLRKKPLIIYISSKSIYGLDAEGILTESTKPQPTDDYGRTKYAGELAVVESGLPYLIMRSSTLFGLGIHNFGFAFPSAITQQLFQGKEINLYSPDFEHEYLYVHDISSSISKLMEINARNEIFNISGPKRSLNQLVNSIYSEIKNNTENPGSIKKINQEQKISFFLDSSKIQKVIGENLYTIDEVVIKRMVDFLKLDSNI